MMRRCLIILILTDTFIAYIDAESPAATTSAQFSKDNINLTVRLAAAEDDLFIGIRRFSPMLTMTRFKVPITGGRHIWTASSDSKPARVVVLLHGFGTGLGIWIRVFPQLALFSHVYAMDLLGFGRSSGSSFPSDPQGVENDFVESIEEWRVQLALTNISLVGHSFGGFLSIAYTLKYPGCVSDLVLVDAWGIPMKPDISHHVNGYKSYLDFSTAIIQAGIHGQQVLEQLRPEFGPWFDPLGLKDQIYKYFYYLFLASSSGVEGFLKGCDQFYWAKRPMIDRLPGLSKNVRVTAVLAGDSWMDNTAWVTIKTRGIIPNLTVHYLNKTGHQIPAQNPVSLIEIMRGILHHGPA